MQPKIFISHSAHEPATSELLGALEQKLTEEGFDVLVDRTRLQPGIDWRANLNEWLATCHGAVLLASPSALDSVWVHIEATILGHRFDRTPAPGFPLMIVRVGGVRSENLRRPEFGLTQLDRIQAAPSDAHDAVFQTAMRMFSDLRSLPETEEGELYFDVSVELRKADEERLKRVGERLDPNAFRWAPAIRRVHPANVLASHLVGLTLNDAARQLRNIWIRPDPAIDPAKTIIALLEPSWTDLRSVEWLVDDFVRQPPPRVAVVAASHLDTITCHLERARRRDRSKSWLDVKVGPLGDREPGDSIAVIMSELSDRLDLSRAEIRQSIVEAAEEGDPVMFLFESRNDYDAVGRALQEAFGPIYCVVCDNMEQGREFNGGAAALMPFVEPNRESNFLRDRRRARTVLASVRP